MDGNRRWAREHNLPELEGHRRVADAVLEKLIEHAADVGIGYLTLWAWSTENWNRTPGEVKGIMNLLRYGFAKFAEKMHKKGIRIQAIGDITRLDPDIRESIKTYIEKTKENKRITVVFAVNYGGRDEIIRALRKMHEHSQFQNPNSKFNEQDFAHYLDTKDIPDPELIIRTGGDMRLSGFLLWQCQYSELLFVDWYMPDFTPKRLDEAVVEYAKRQRRFGR